jgi:hypothetical protein
MDITYIPPLGRLLRNRLPGNGWPGGSSPSLPCWTGSPGAFWHGGYRSRSLVPMAQTLIGNSKVVGILASESNALQDRHLTSVGVQLGSNYVVGGAMDDGSIP